jgi:hypothetical protein
MKNLLHTSVLACGLFIISIIGITAFADEQKVSKTNWVVTHSLNKLPEFPLQQKPIEKVQEGKVHFYNIAENDFAAIYLTNAPDQATKDWMVKHYDRMQVYAPWFNDTRIWIAPNQWEHIDHTEWYPNGLEYKDLYAIYDCAQKINHNACDSENPNQEHREMYDQAMLAEADPKTADWILKDSLGNPLYIPFKCSETSGNCPQFAADISNPAFRQLWIKQMSTALQGGNYRGLFVDDVNLDRDRALSNGQCTIKGQGKTCKKWTMEITKDEWADYVANFTEQIRSAFPDDEIAHNSVWFHIDPDDPYLSPYLDRQVDAADYIELERGINDPGIKAGTHPLGIVSFLEFNDYLHERGRKMVHYIYINKLANDGEFSQDNPVLAQALLPPLNQLEYGLAGWLLVSDGNDLFGAGKFNTPTDWWHGFDTNLGKALGSRHEDFQGLSRRDFEHGIVLLNGPGTGSVTVTLPDTFYTLAGDPVNEIVLGSRVGKILLRNSPKWDWNVLDGPVPPGAQTAVGDGSDEQARLQNVLDLAAPNDVIYFPEPPVAYGVEGNLRIDKPLTMLGDGWLSGSATTDGNFGGAELRQLDNGQGHRIKT